MDDEKCTPKVALKWATGTRTTDWSFAIKRTRWARIRSYIGRWARRAADRIDPWGASSYGWTDITDLVRSVDPDEHVGSGRATITMSNRDRRVDPMQPDAR